MTRQQRVADALALPGSLFFVLVQPELRRQGLSFLSFYALQRIIEEADEGGRYSESWLRVETGMQDYETSRACRRLVASALTVESRHQNDRRVKALLPTALGRRVLNRILAAAGMRLWEGTSTLGRVRRVREVTAHLRKANRILHGSFQLSFFDYTMLPDGNLRRRAPERINK